MALFGLPTGEFELLLKHKGRGRYKTEWQTVMFADRLDLEDVASVVEDWSKNYNVVGARYNGKAVDIPTKYHWEFSISPTENEGYFNTYEEAIREATLRRRANKKEKDKSKWLRSGMPVVVYD